MYTTNDLEFPQLEIFEDCSRAPPPPEPTNTRRASPISPRPSSAISPRHFLSRSLKSILVPQKAHIIHISQISPRQFHSHQGPLLYNSLGRVDRTSYQFFLCGTHVHTILNQKKNRPGRQWGSGKVKIWPKITPILPLIAPYSDLP